MVELVIKHSFVEVNKSFVHLKQYGQSKKNLLPVQTISNIGNKLCNKVDETKTNHLVIFIPGNPGPLGIYHDFLKLLAEKMNETTTTTTTILAISHNDFDHPDHVDFPAEEKLYIDEKELNFVEKTLSKKYLHDPHHIELQVLNKLIILRRLLINSLSDSTKVIFVGHSIGCYVILRLLQDKQLANFHTGSILIHPALENLAQTEKGQYYVRVFNLRIDFAMKLAGFLLDNLIPRPLKLMITRHFCSEEFAQSSSDEVLETMMQLACSRHLDALISMAKSELAYVKQLDCDQLIKPHLSKIKFLYATTDHWVNESHRRAMKRLYRDDIHVEERDTMHAFVMDPNAVIEYANIVANFITQVSV